jgi:catechol 2,3-dioxygenase-like lactoylglutathione lyase family enzyme
MPNFRLDHVNVRTMNVEAMTAWYERVLGLVNGPRPPFGFPGAWLYAGEFPIVHLVGMKSQPVNTDPTLEHFAVSSTGMIEFIAHLEKLGERYDLRYVPGYRIPQVNVWDPDGNHIHVDFPVAEGEAYAKRAEVSETVLYGKKM